MTPATTEPAETSARYVAGLTQLSSGQVEASIETFRCVLARDPSHAGARRNLIRALIAVRDHAAIIVEADLALRDAPESGELHFQRGTALNALRRPGEARADLTASIALNPKYAPAWLNLGNAFMDLDNLSAAEVHCRQALALDPTLIEARVSLGFNLTAQGRVAEAIGELEEAVRARPGYVHAHWNLAAATLLAGDLPRGFTEYEWRKRHELFRHDFTDLPGPVWDGGNPCGRRILVLAEQGLGDTVQFARYLLLIASRGGLPILACHPSLIPLLNSITGIQAVSKFDPLPPHDAWIDQMSLPYVLGTTLESIPFPAGYLSADPALTAAHRATIPPNRSIGLAWAGNPSHRNDRRRTPPVEAFAPLVALPACHVINLVPDRVLTSTEQPTRLLTDYAETAAMIAALDLIVTVDSSVAHVAGALGRPAWLLLPFAPDWRWMVKRDDTPWYNSLRLFRQPSPGDWTSVIQSVIAALRAEWPR
jgi:tetratricopeptide (TPR) repeat protein